MNVRELLQSKKEAVITIDSEDTIGAAAHKMSANKIAALVVMKDDAPVRIISEKDIVRSLADDGPQAGRRVIASLPVCQRYSSAVFDGCQFHQPPDL